MYICIKNINRGVPKVICVQSSVSLLKYDNFCCVKLLNILALIALTVLFLFKIRYKSINDLLLYYNGH